MEKLNKVERAELRKLESVIGRGQKAFLETCRALQQIEANNLYKAFGSITAYCRDRWDFTKSETSRYRIAGHVLANLSDFEQLPKNESQTRALGELKHASHQQEVWRVVVESGDKITAASIQQTAERLYGPTTPKTQPDTTPEPTAVERLVSIVHALEEVDVTDAVDDDVAAQLDLIDKAVAKMRRQVMKIAA